MSLKQEIESWVSALSRYDNNEFEEALKEFDNISDTSKILFNMGVIHATLGEHEKAVECYQRAIRLDQYLAVAYFQQGVSNFLLGDFEEALANFNDTLLYLRGNTMIDYAQLGLLFKLYSCEVLFNRGLCYIYLQQKDAGLQDLNFAVKEKVVEDHNVIDEAIREEAEGYTVFSIPVGVVYRPNEAKVRNLKTKDYLGKARLVAASDRANAFTGFAGSEIKNAGRAAEKDDRPADNISFAATNLVKPGLQSRRQQSEPPAGRNAFPPTPPPENDKPAAMTRAASVRNGPKPMPARLNIPEPSKSNRYDKMNSPRSERKAPSRSASEMRSPPRSFSRAEQPRMRRSRNEDDGYPEDVYDMYGGGGGNGNNNGGGSSVGRGQSRRNPRYIEEEEEASDYDSFDEGEFEMVSNRRPGTSVAGGSSRGGSRRPEIRKVRIKVHAEDVRYVMVSTTIEFSELVDRIRDKFGLRRRFKLKVRDEDVPQSTDMITMGDQDDLDVAMIGVKQMARKQRLDIGKLEIWVQEI
ncbi:Neutrophil cytosol factor 2 [Daldinia childiae]|uniref:Neutrophil cytosol factor 2 n=1 Tax=Daldinia childiae TaxID=326645 RepID=UPI0014469B2D|nr:Neutrophil cytosol factor 2 [Daldinia childiae]KAF3064727.1 Neutrophil cytosol factor 2 [Daldinia childiae]